MYGQFTNYCAKHNIHDYVNDLLIETGKGELDYFVYIRLDDESMKQKRISLCCPDKIMTCFPWTIDLEEKQKMEQKMKNKKVPDPSKRHRLS